MFLLVTLVLYLAGTGFFLGDLLRRAERLSRLSLAVTGLGFLSHTVALFGPAVMAERVLFSSLHEALSFFSWALVVVFLWVELRYQIHVLGSFILPLALLSLLAAASLPEEVPALDVKTVSVHVTLSTLGTVGFAVAFVAGLMYLIQDRLLKSRRFNVLYAKLPPLDFLDRLNEHAIATGFPLLTLGIIAGALSAGSAHGSYLTWNPEQTWALITWVFYCVVLIGRLTVGWRAKRAAYLTIIGFAGVILTFIGVVVKGHASIA